MFDCKDLCFSYSGFCLEPYVSIQGFSGSADVSISVSLPNARENTPKLSIRQGFGGMDIFGYGFTLGLPYMERMSQNGKPDFNRGDKIFHPDYGAMTADSSPVPARYYPYSSAEVSRVKYDDKTDTFRETLKDGTSTTFAPGPVSADGRGFVYFPVKTADLYGTTVKYSYLETGEIEKIEYGDMPGGGYAFTVEFFYESRRDKRISFRGGFPDERALRCRLITISASIVEKKILREISFQFDEKSGYSRLCEITETGFSKSGQRPADPVCISYNDSDLPVVDITPSFRKINTGGEVFPVSLYGEGASGLFESGASGTWYYSPLPPNGLTPCFSDKKIIRRLPAGLCCRSGSRGSDFKYRFTDLDGNGGLQYLSDDLKGYYEIKDGEFSAFIPFEKTCPVHSGTEFADLYGDGRLSAFTVTELGETARGEIHRGLGKKGFGQGVFLDLPEGFPQKSSGKTMLSGFVDFYGDGLCHRVAVRQKSVLVFPNLGGAFGEGKAVENPPDFGDDFDPERLRFADTTGSRTADLVYIRQDKILIYRNIGGTFFMPPAEISLPEKYTDLDSVYFADFRGDIIPQLIFIKRSVSGTRVYSLSFYDRFLPVELYNGRGLKYSISYLGTGKYMLEDFKKGLQSGNTPLRAPVVSSLTRFDLTTGEEDRTEYSYSNFQFIKDKRSIYGFETVTEKHTNRLPEFDSPAADLLPPDRVKTVKYFTGGETSTDKELALTGQPVSASYADANGSRKLLTNRKYRAVPLDEKVNGCFLSQLSEEETVIFGKSGKGQRITKTSFSYDSYGNVTETVKRFLPREGVGLSEQQTGCIERTNTVYINIDTEKTFLVGVPACEKSFSGGEENAEPDSLREYYYADPATGEALPFGECKEPALLHHTRDLAFLSGDKNIAGFEKILTENCGYCLENEGYYVSGAEYSYDPKLFYAVSAVKLDEDAADILYDDSGIFLVSINHRAQNGMILTEKYTPDYDICMYSSSTDLNGNTEYYAYDPFGNLSGLSYSAAINHLSEPSSAKDVIKNPEAFLADGLDVFFYNDFSGTMPGVVKILRKNSGEEEFSLSVTSLDGFGRVLSRSVSDTDYWIISEKCVTASGVKILEYPPFYSDEPDGVPGCLPTGIQYDELGRTIKVFTPHNEDAVVWLEQEFLYEPWSMTKIDHRISSDDPITIRYDLDPCGNIISESFEESDGDTLCCKIKRTGRNISALSDGRFEKLGKENIRFICDKLGHTVKTVSADAGTSFRLYGAGGKLIYESLNGTEKLYSYDMCGRFLSLQIKTKNSDWKIAQQVIWGEEAGDPAENNLLGRIYKRIDPSGTTVYGKYDRFGHALEISRSYSDMSYSENKTVKASYLYNDAGELVRSSTGNFSLEYRYSGAGRLLAVFSQNEELISDIKFTADGEICSEILSGGLESNLDYDNATHFLKNMSVSLGDKKIFESVYTYTAQGNPSSAAFYVLDQNPFLAEFEYDIYNRLIRSKMTRGELASNEEYSYDIGGNMTAFIRRDSSGKAIVTRSYEISDVSNRIDAVTINGVRSELPYDEYGRLSKLINEKEISFDEFGRLSSVDSKNSSEKYTYDAKGSRAQKSGSDEKYTVYFSEESSAGEYALINGELEMLRLGFGGGLNALLLKTAESQSVLWQVTDLGGSVILTLGGDGEMIHQEYFSPYGDSEETETVAPYRFAGKEYDTESGLYYFGARYYSPELGRMITSDDAAFASAEMSGLNLYAYCLDNPEAFRDVSGNFPEWLIKAGEAIVVAGTGGLLGFFYKAITPLRAAAAAATSSAVGALLFTNGGLNERLLSAFQTGALVGTATFASNYVKERAVSRFPKLNESPRETAVGALSANVALGALAGMIPFGSGWSNMVGIIGGGALGVVGSIFKLGPGHYILPQTTGNELELPGNVHSVNNKYVIELNGSEVGQWMNTSLSPIIHDVYTQQANAQADLVVIVHGGEDMVFTDKQFRQNGEVYHRVLTGEALAGNLSGKLQNLNLGIDLNTINTIKLISCHGAESRPLLPSTAQVLADRLGKIVYAYHGEISISEVSRNTNPVLAEKFTPRKGFGGHLLTRLGF